MAGKQENRTPPSAAESQFSPTKPGSTFRDQDTLPPDAFTESSIYNQETLPPDTSVEPAIDVSNDSVAPALAQTAPASEALTDSRGKPSTQNRKTPESSSGGELRPGQIIGGQYELIRQLGRGGMGTVHLARDVRLGRRVAIKFVSVESRTAKKMFLAEARTTARCTHENIVIIHAVDEHRGAPYMVLEYIEGKTLSQLMGEYRAMTTSRGEPPEPVSGRRGRGRGMSPERAVEIMIPVLRALEHAHGMGIVHRDLKPANIMVNQAGVIKVLDFGIATVKDDNLSDSIDRSISGPKRRDAATSPGGLVGTIQYMAPEQLAEGDLDHRVDIWAIGLMLFEMVTGRHPMAPLSMGKFMEIANLDIPMVRVSDIRSGVGGLGTIIDRCLIKSRADRMGSARQLLDELQALMPEHGRLVLGQDESPFSGLSAFQETDADRFFGRAEDIAEVVTRVRNQPVVAVVGPSGAGKSSLIRAGVIPALKRSGEGWEALIIRPGRTPMAALASLLEQLFGQATTSFGATGMGKLDESGDKHTVDEPQDHSQLIARLTREPGYLGARLRDWAKRKLRRVLVFIDQFEEIYTLHADPREQQAFFACVAGVADDLSSPLRVITAMRSDFLERLVEIREHGQFTRGLFLLPPMGRDGLRAALVRPVEAAGHRFEKDDMVEHMLDALASTRGALPLLQFAATTLWQKRERERRLLTSASYEAMGGISGTLAKHADAVLAGMSAHRQVLARAIFERLVTPERTRAIAEVAELRALPGDPGDIESVLDDLTNARLIVADTGGASGGTVEIVHESLITGWPTLRRWLDENQDDSAFLARLRTAAQAWAKSDRSEGMLWRGEVADEAQLWRRHYHGALTDRDERFLRAVFRLADRARRRRRNITVGLISVLTLMLAVAVGVILWILQAQDRAAAQNRTIAAQKQEIAEKLVHVQREKERAEQEQQHAKSEAERADKERERAEDEAAKAQAAAQNAREASRRAEDEKTRAVRSAQIARLAERRAREAERTARSAAARAQEAEHTAKEAEQLAREAEQVAKDAADAERLSKERLEKLSREQEELLHKLGIRKPSPQ